MAEKVAAGLDLIDSGLDQLQGLSRTATGSVRFNVMHDAATLLIRPILPVFAERFPHIEIEVTVDDHFVDVTAEGFDAGIRYSGTIPEDMIAAPLSPALRWVVVGSPDYLARKGRPKRRTSCSVTGAYASAPVAARSTNGNSSAAKTAGRSTFRAFS